jgi:hypothetical protein
LKYTTRTLRRGYHDDVVDDETPFTAGGRADDESQSSSW